MFMGGTCITAGQVGLVFVKIKPTLENSQRTISHGKDPTAQQKKETFP